MLSHLDPKNTICIHYLGLIYSSLPLNDIQLYHSVCPHRTLDNNILPFKELFI